VDLGLRGKRALITGGTRGIGRAIVDAFAAEGCHVALCARNGEAVRATVDALTRYGIKATGEAVDVAAGERLQAWVHTAACALGGLDILVANASGKTRPAGDAGWRRNFAVDVLGTVHAVEAARPFLERSSAAAVIVIASGAAVETFYAPAGCNPTRR
jgi:NAD(P)-dependent dehydrogenase (short-subunit alcohol dehydrogenase family)